MKALIIGGSIAGLFAALLLRQRGVDVVVFERARSELSGRGAGIATHPQILEVLGSWASTPANWASRSMLDACSARTGVWLRSTRGVRP